MYRMLTSLQCRDLGLTGNFLRVDYSVDCNTSNYKSFMGLSGVGVCIYSIGIPLLFGFVVKNRNSFFLKSPSKLLYENYKDNFCYFEVFEMARKFLLTSMLIFVSEPGRPSMALYLLIVNDIALCILCSYHPFRHIFDNILCIFLVSVECLVFLVSFIILSGVSEVDGYDENDIFSTVFAAILIAICFVAPLTLALKFNFLSKVFASSLRQIFFVSDQKFNDFSDQKQNEKNSQIELNSMVELNPLAPRTSS
jgi:hypothetical protein